MKIEFLKFDIIHSWGLLMLNFFFNSPHFDSFEKEKFGVTEI